MPAACLAVNTVCSQLLCLLAAAAAKSLSLFAANEAAASAIAFRLASCASRSSVANSRFESDSRMASSRYS